MFSIKSEKSSIKKFLFLIMSLYFLISLFGVLKYGDANLLGTLSKANNDDVRYIRSAETFLSTGKVTYHDINEPTAYIMPGITLFVAFFMKIFGNSFGVRAFRIFQVIIQTASIYIIFLTGRKIFNSSAALLACLISFLSISEYYAPTLVLTETLFKFLTLFLIYFSIYAVEEKETLYYVLGGIFWFASCMFRPTAAAYPAVILVMWIVKKYKFKDMVKFTAITSLIFCTLMSPWWIRNYVEFNKFIPFTASSGNPFLKGTYVNYNYSVDGLLDQAGETIMEKNQNEMNAALYRLKNNTAKHPMEYIYWYTIGKSYYLWSSPFYWKEMFHISINSAVCYHTAVLLCALLGTVLLFIKKNKNFLYIFLTIIYYSLIYLPFFTFNRYSYPVMPFVNILSGYFIYKCCKKISLSFSKKHFYTKAA